MDVVRSKGQKVYLIQSAEKGIRVDGRNVSDHRPIVLERGILRTGDGSARVRLGRTEVFAVVNAELMEVEDSSKHDHKLNFTVKVIPQGPSAPFFDEDEDDRDNDNDDMDREEVFTVTSRADYHDDRDKRAFREDAGWSVFGGQDDEEKEQDDCETFEASPATDLEDALDVIFNTLSSIDYTPFSVSRNHVWSVDVEIMVAKYAGNLFEAVYLATKAALFDFRAISPPVKHDGESGKDLLKGGETYAAAAGNDEVEGSELKEWGIDVDRIPPAGIAYRIGNSTVLDVNEFEAILAPVKCFVAIERPANDRLPDDECRMLLSQLSGGGSAKPTAQREMFGMAVRSARHLDKILRGYLTKWEGEEIDPHRTVHLTFEK